MWGRRARRSNTARIVEREGSSANREPVIHTTPAPSTASQGMSAAARVMSGPRGWR